MDYRKIGPLLTELLGPLAALTCSHGGADNALIVASTVIGGIVPDRPRVAVQVHKGSYSHRLVAGSQSFALCFLRKDQASLVRDLGFVSGRDRDKLAGLEYTRGVTGSPLLADCLGFMDCRAINSMDCGDMTFFLGEALEGDITVPGEALSWSYVRTVMPNEWREEWRQKFDAEIAMSRETMDRIDPVWPSSG